MVGKKENYFGPSEKTSKDILPKEEIVCTKAPFSLFKYPKYITKEHTLHFNGKKIQVYNIL